VPGSGTAGRWAAAARSDGVGGVGRCAEAGRCGDGGGSTSLAEAPGSVSSQDGRGDGGAGTGRALVSATVARWENLAA
jgi:hypothetical protein